MNRSEVVTIQCLFKKIQQNLLHFFSLVGRLMSSGYYKQELCRGKRGYEIPEIYVFQTRNLKLSFHTSGSLPNHQAIDSFGVTFAFTSLKASFLSKLHPTIWSIAICVVFFVSISRQHFGVWMHCEITMHYIHGFGYSTFEFVTRVAEYSRMILSYNGNGNPKRDYYTQEYYGLQSSADGNYGINILDEREMEIEWIEQGLQIERSQGVNQLNRSLQTQGHGHIAGIKQRCTTDPNMKTIIKIVTKQGLTFDRFELKGSAEVGFLGTISKSSAKNCTEPTTESQVYNCQFFIGYLDLHGFICELFALLSTTLTIINEHCVAEPLY
ncbi:hypothetical protein Anapl_05858 [Anas platyrhynchos]|uniref:Uncharacterized protein n=1 Tax=Anas platyrhynchos TaxID=8839 RepID=R0KDX8_ANAPL|nr:hypothetical protein Anapl_05858 [Anas platyrhynchos]